MMPRAQNNELDSIDRLSREIVEAVRVSDGELDATAGSPDLYKRVQVQIAARRDSAAQQSFNRKSQNRILALVGTWLRLGWAFAGVVAALSITIIVVHLMTRPRVEQNTNSQQASVGESKPPRSADDGSGMGGSGMGRSVMGGNDGVATDNRSADRQPREKPRSSRRHLRAMPPDSYTAEVATDFIPLTYIADSAQMDSAHVVRVRMPRSALISLGLPMNYERASELVKADVLIGDDGLARAIRFIQ